MKHHYIPKFYLTPWLGDDTKLTEFRNITNPHTKAQHIEVKRRGLNETGFVENLYTLVGTSQETKDNVEKIFMGAVDGRAAVARDQLLQGIIPEGELRFAWARFLLSLMLRTPEQIKSFKAVMRLHWEQPDAEIQSRYADARQPGWPLTLEGWVKEMNPKAVERSAILIATRLMQQENTLNLFMGAMWWVLDTSALHKPFMTSDHPILMTNGLGRPDGHFALPISPTKLFVGFMNAEISEEVRKLSFGRLIRNTNHGVIGQGRRSVYAVDDLWEDSVRLRMGQRDYFTPLPKSVVDARAALASHDLTKVRHYGASATKVFPGDRRRFTCTKGHNLLWSAFECTPLNSEEARDRDILAPHH